MEKRYLAKRIGQNRVAAGKPRESHNPGQIYCEESFGEDEATEKTPWNKAKASASKPETSASSSGDDHSLLMQLMAKIETLEASQQGLAREPRSGARARQEEAGEKRPEEAGRAAGASTRREEAEPLRRECSGLARRIPHPPVLGRRRRREERGSDPERGLWLGHAATEG